MERRVVWIPAFAGMTCTWTSWSFRRKPESIELTGTYWEVTKRGEDYPPGPMLICSSDRKIHRAYRACLGLSTSAHSSNSINRLEIVLTVRSPSPLPSPPSWVERGRSSWTAATNIRVMSVYEAIKTICLSTPFFKFLLTNFQKSLLKRQRNHSGR